MQIVPLASIPAQNLQVTLANQPCTINLATLSTGLYFSLDLNGESICANTICEDQALILKDRRYAGFVGDFVFVDTRGNDDPQYAGLGTRWFLVYLEAADLL